MQSYSGSCRQMGRGNNLRSDSQNHGLADPGLGSRARAEIQLHTAVRLLECNRLLATGKRAMEKIHRRASQETGNEKVGRIVIDGKRASTCWMTPSFITTMRVPIVIAST